MRNPSMRLSFVGDIALNGNYQCLIAENVEKNLATAINPFVSTSNLVIGNLESPLTSLPSAGPPWRFTLHGNPSYASVLRDAGFTVLSIANNHAMDHGWEGLKETFGHLEAAGIKYVGAGANLRESRKPLFINVREFRIAILAYCGVPTASPLYASTDQPGVAPLYRSFILDDIAAVRGQCDLTILCLHWGQENVSAPAPRNRRLARELIAAGANIVVGHHPHVLQGSERVGRGIVAYSLGNFTFSDEDWRGKNKLGEAFVMPYRLNESNRRSAVWRLSIGSRSEILEEAFVPVYLSPDLVPVPDLRTERKKDLEAQRGALKVPCYRLFWTVRMIRSRFIAALDQFHNDGGFGARLLRLRPRHFRDLVNLLCREWEQFRGME